MKKREFIKKASLMTTSVIGLPFIDFNEELHKNEFAYPKNNTNGITNSMNLVIGGDHAGFPLKGPLIEILQSWGYKVKDVGSFNSEPVDFPDIALSLVNEIVKGNAERGIMVCGTGVGASVACNKIKGVRAALCHDSYSAHQCVEHDNVNVLCLGAQIVGIKLAEELMHNFLNAKFSDQEQFRRRVKKLDELHLKQ